MHNIEQEIRNIIKYMDDHDQPYEDMFEEIIKIVNKQHDEWYNEFRISDQEAQKVRVELEKYMKRVKILMDGFDKIIEGKGLPVTIAVESVTEAITVIR